MNAIEHRQEVLDLHVVRRAHEAIGDDVIRRQPDLRAAIRLCVDVSGLLEKQVCLELTIDNGHWARIKKGEAHFPPEKLNLLMDVCGNEIPLRWQNMKRGYGMVRLKSEVEVENELLRMENAEKDKKLAYFEEIIQKIHGR